MRIARIPSALAALSIVLALAVPAGAGEPAKEKKEAGQSGGSSVEGEWENADQKTIVELLPKGKAFLSFHGLTQECSYRVEGKKITMTCDGEDTVFTIEDDGTLAGPKESFLARMKRKKT
jgi:hypothetical protein